MMKHRSLIMNGALMFLEKSHPHLKFVVESDMETQEEKDLASEILGYLDRKQ